MRSLGTRRGAHAPGPQDGQRLLKPKTHLVIAGSGPHARLPDPSASEGKPDTGQVISPGASERRGRGVPPPPSKLTTNCSGLTTGGTPRVGLPQSGLGMQQAPLEGAAGMTWREPLPRVGWYGCCRRLTPISRTTERPSGEPHLPGLACCFREPQFPIRGASRGEEPNGCTEPAQDPPSFLVLEAGVSELVLGTQPAG